VLPVGLDGKQLNLDFETGTLKDWIAEGPAFQGQPIDGDTVVRRRQNMRSGHQGRYWIGTYERMGDAPQGTLTSVPFAVTHLWASFLVGGGGPHPTTCVELVRRDTAEVFSRTSGIDEEQMRRVVVDLRPHLGQQIFIRLVDRWPGHWGHINFDDFRFHSKPPDMPPRPAPRDRYDILVDPGFERGLLTWSLAVYGAQPVVVADPKIVHGGNASLRITATRLSDVALGQEVRLYPGRHYRLSGWVRTQRLNPHKAPVYGTFQVQRPGGQGVIASGPNHGGTHDWTRIEIPFQAPPDGLVRISVFFVGFGKGTGTAWFGDLRLERVNTPGQ
jgi:hypothetical protein